MSDTNPGDSSGEEKKAGWIVSFKRQAARLPQSGSIEPLYELVRDTDVGHRVLTLGWVNQWDEVYPGMVNLFLRMIQDPEAWLGLNEGAAGGRGLVMGNLLRRTAEILGAESTNRSIRPFAAVLGVWWTEAAQLGLVNSRHGQNTMMKVFGTPMEPEDVLWLADWVRFNGAVGTDMSWPRFINSTLKWDVMLEWLRQVLAKTKPLRMEELNTYHGFITSMGFAKPDDMVYLQWSRLRWSVVQIGVERSSDTWAGTPSVRRWAAVHLPESKVGDSPQFLAAYARRLYEEWTRASALWPGSPESGQKGLQSWVLTFPNVSEDLIDTRTHARVQDLQLTTEDISDDLRRVLARKDARTTGPRGEEKEDWTPPDSENALDMVREDYAQRADVYRRRAQVMKTADSLPRWKRALSDSKRVIEMLNLSVHEGFKNMFRAGRAPANYVQYRDAYYEYATLDFAVRGTPLMTAIVSKAGDEEPFTAIKIVPNKLLEPPRDAVKKELWLADKSMKDNAEQGLMFDDDLVFSAVDRDLRRDTARMLVRGYVAVLAMRVAHDFAERYFLDEKGKPLPIYYKSWKTAGLLDTTTSFGMEDVFALADKQRLELLFKQGEFTNMNDQFDLTPYNRAKMSQVMRGYDRGDVTALVEVARRLRRMETASEEDERRGTEHLMRAVQNALRPRDLPYFAHLINLHLMRDGDARREWRGWLTKKAQAVRAVGEGEALDPTGAVEMLGVLSALMYAVVGEQDGGPASRTLVQFVEDHLYGIARAVTEFGPRPRIEFRGEQEFPEEFRGEVVLGKDTPATTMADAYQAALGGGPSAEVQQALRKLYNAVLEEMRVSAWLIFSDGRGSTSAEMREAAEAAINSEAFREIADQLDVMEATIAEMFGGTTFEQQLDKAGGGARLTAVMDFLRDFLAMDVATWYEAFPVAQKVVVGEHVSSDDVLLAVASTLDAARRDYKMYRNTEALAVLVLAHTYQVAHIRFKKLRTEQVVDDQTVVTMVPTREVTTIDVNVVEFIDYLVEASPKVWKVALDRAIRPPYDLERGLVSVILLAATYYASNKPVKRKLERAGIDSAFLERLSEVLAHPTPDELADAEAGASNMAQFTALRTDKTVDAIRDIPLRTMVSAFHDPDFNADLWWGTRLLLKVKPDTEPQLRDLWARMGAEPAFDGIAAAALGRSAGPASEAPRVSKGGYHSPGLRTRHGTATVEAALSKMLGVLVVVGDPFELTGESLLWVMPEDEAPLARLRWRWAEEEKAIIILAGQDDAGAAGVELLYLKDLLTTEYARAMGANAVREATLEEVGRTRRLPMPSTQARMGWTRVRYDLSLRIARGLSNAFIQGSQGSRVLWQRLMYEREVLATYGLDELAVCFNLVERNDPAWLLVANRSAYMPLYNVLLALGDAREAAALALMPDFATARLLSRRNAPDDAALVWKKQVLYKGSPELVRDLCNQAWLDKHELRVLLEVARREGMTKMLTVLVEYRASAVCDLEQEK